MDFFVDFHVFVYIHSVLLPMGNVFIAVIVFCSGAGACWFLMGFVA